MFRPHRGANGKAETEQGLGLSLPRAWLKIEFGSTFRFQTPQISGVLVTKLSHLSLWGCLSLCLSVTPMHSCCWACWYRSAESERTEKMIRFLQNRYLGRGEKLRVVPLLRDKQAELISWACLAEDSWLASTEDPQHRLYSAHREHYLCSGRGDQRQLYSSCLVLTGSGCKSDFISICFMSELFWFFWSPALFLVDKSRYISGR